MNQLELFKQITNTVGNLGTFIVLELKNSGLISFKVNDIDAMGVLSKRKEAIKSMLKSVQLSDKIDKLFIGSEAYKNIYNIKRTMPNRQFRLHLVSEGEIVSTAISSRYYPTGVLHDYEVLANVFNTCLTSAGDVPIIINKIEDSKEKAKKEPKVLTSLEQEEKAQKERDRKASIEALKKQRAEYKAERAAMNDKVLEEMFPNISVLN